MWTSRDNVWVANRGAWPIMQFDKNGKLLQTWNSDTVRLYPGSAKEPTGIRVDPDGNIWLRGRRRPHHFQVQHGGAPVDGAGALVRASPANNDSQVGFNRPTNLGSCPNRHFYVSDGYGNRRIVEFTPDGEYVRHWGNQRTGDGQFALPHAVTVDSKGLIYVADRANSRITGSSMPTGKFIAKWTDVGQALGDPTTSPRRTRSTCATEFTAACTKMRPAGQKSWGVELLGQGRRAKVDYATTLRSIRKAASTSPRSRTYG